MQVSLNSLFSPHLAALDRWMLNCQECGILNYRLGGVENVSNLQFAESN